MISGLSEGRSQTGTVHGGKGVGLAVVRDSASLFRGSRRAAGSRRSEDLKFSSRKAKQSMDDGSSRMKPKGTARKK